MYIRWWLLSLVVLAGILAGCGSDDPPDECAGVVPVCSAQEECTGGATCDPCGRCVGGSDLCTGDDDCAEGERCEAGSCVDAGCASDEDCGSGESCIEGSCVVTDCKKAGCSDGLNCREADGLCVECLSDSYCTDAEAPFCENDSGTCVGCRSDLDCTAGLRCSPDFACVSCVENSDCSEPTPVCNQALGACGLCNTDDDCPSGSHCREDATCYLGPEHGEACTPDGSCAPGFLCIGGTCAASCDLYEPDCPSGTGCDLLGNGEGRALFEGGEPVAACLDASEGAAAERPCGGAIGCKPGLFCVPTSVDGGICKPFCSPDDPNPSCSTGDVCMALSLGADGEEVGLCHTPNSWLDLCVNDGDCQNGLGCTPSLEDGALVGRCAYTAGTGAPTTPCTDGDECRSGMCLEGSGFCWGGCETNEDCGSGNHCMQFTFNIGNGQTAPFNGCVPGCLSDLDCRDLGDSSVCGLGIIDDQLVGVCTLRDGPANPGDFCTANEQCGTGVCFTNGTSTSAATAGFCSGPCEVDADCSENTACRETALRIGGTDVAPIYSTLDMCWGGSCTSHADCPASWACGTDLDPQDTERYRLSCSPQVGTLEGGAACTSNADCRGGACVQFTGAASSICFDPCDTDLDCGDTAFCGPVSIGDLTVVNACIPLL